MLSLFNKMDPRGEGEVSFEAFLRTFYPLAKTSENSQAHLILKKWKEEIFKSEKFFDQRKREIQDSQSKYREAFSYLDLNRKGCRQS